MFTDKELEIMDLIYKGLLQQEIADKLFIERSTVNTHTSNIYKKTGVTNVNQFMALHIKDLKKQIKRLEINVKQLEKYKQKWEFLRNSEMGGRC